NSLSRTRVLEVDTAHLTSVTIVRATTENRDVTVTPNGLADEATPLAALIITACDAYSAMTSDRPYRAARTPAAAVAELRRCAGRQFDCQVVELLCAVLVDEAEPARLAVGT